MSGTSLDGLDVACCRFFSDEQRRGGIGYELVAADTYPYDEQWRQRLATLHEADALSYALADVQLGEYFGQRVNEFVAKHHVKVDCIASHGHTVFHQPDKHLTTQIADGNAIHAVTGLPVVCNFRALDVALGGQGAPLVPIGDRLLFGDYEACLNLGGFANVSYDDAEGRRVAFDVSPCNMPLNELAALCGRPYDKDGLLASQGVADAVLLQRLNALPYYSQQPPKSLGKEWYLDSFRRLILDVEPHVALATVVEHVAVQVARSLKGDDATEGRQRRAQLRAVAPIRSRRAVASMLVTGGGAKNSYLIERIRQNMQGVEVVVPPDDVVDYKEAIVFALLGYLRLRGETNVLASVTGARRDSCCGDVIGEMKVEE